MTSRSHSGTRDLMLVALRRGPATIERLTSELGITRTAVRLQLARLERDGLVARGGVQRGRTKPTALYALTPFGECELSHAYAPLLAHMLRVLSARLSRAELDGLMREIGRSMLAGRPRPGGPLRERVAAAGAVFDELGALTVVEAGDGAHTLTLRSHGCPFAELSAKHPEVCSMMEELFRDFVDAPVSTCCERAPRPRCCFLIGAGALSSPRDRQGSP